MMRSKPRLGLTAALCLATIVLAATGCRSMNAAKGSMAAPVVTDDYYDIGDFHREIRTDSAEAQRWFNRGLVQCYGFNHGEAIRCFERAAEADPNCAMTYWGIAYANAPYINNTDIDEAAWAHWNPKGEPGRSTLEMTQYPRFEGEARRRIDKATREEAPSVKARLRRLGVIDR